MKQVNKDELIIRESMSLAFSGGEIWFEQLDALNVYKEIILDKFKKDMDIIRKPSSPSLIAINLNETLVDEEIAAIIITSFHHANSYIRKVVFVGIDKPTKKLLVSIIKRLDNPLGFAYTFINDYEKAKEWLVSDNVS